ncbi:MAG: LysM peptidoglycan-binding domain-containing protein [Lachnospiraceae bacterium]|nr:LysM peptidoglycan-binding domain-containing protein [Lachnospiraceae bacterium]
MAFCRTTIHVVQPGDTFYRLAQRYQTTVPEIIMKNPGINPYNLQVGTRLTICSGQGNNTAMQDEVQLNNDMRKSWLQHIFWARMLMTSLFENLEDMDAVEAKTMRIPEDIAEVFVRFYPKAQMEQLTRLLAEHTDLTSQMMSAMKSEDMQRMDQMERLWYQNAEKLAALLSSMNRAYSYEDLLQSFGKHLDMLKRQMSAALDGNHEEEIRIFEENENQLMELADYLTEGLLQQFYRS